MRVLLPEVTPDEVRRHLGFAAGGNFQIESRFAIPCRVDFRAALKAAAACRRRSGLSARKLRVEEWFARQMGLTFEQWREAQMRAVSGA